MRVRISRVHMAGGGVAYDVLVPESEVPRHVRGACPGGSYYTRVVPSDSNGEEFLRFEDATLSREHVEMPQGIERLRDWTAHKDRADREAFALAAHVFPELRKMPNNRLRVWYMEIPERFWTNEVRWAVRGEACS